MAVTVKNNGAGFMKAVDALLKQQVLVGIPAGSARSATDGSGTSLTNAELGYIHEHGAPEANIPERPFLVPGVESIRDRVAAIYKKAGAAALAGDLAAVDAAHMKVGLLAESAVKSKITEGPFTPLSPVTLKRRKVRGRMNESPLIDTQEMRRSVKYIIRTKGK